MSTAQLLILCVTFLAGGAGVCAVVVVCVRERRQAPEDGPLARPRRLGHRVTVHTKRPDDQTFFGVISSEFEDRLTLENAELVTPQGTHKLPGRQDIRIQDISWIDDLGLVTLAAAPPVERAA